MKQMQFPVLTRLTFHLCSIPPLLEENWSWSLQLKKIYFLETEWNSKRSGDALVDDQDECKNVRINELNATNEFSKGGKLC